MLEEEYILQTKTVCMRTQKCTYELFWKNLRSSVNIWLWTTLIPIPVCSNDWTDTPLLNSAAHKSTVCTTTKTATTTEKKFPECEAETLIGAETE